MCSIVLVSLVSNVLQLTWNSWVCKKAAGWSTCDMQANALNRKEWIWMRWLHYEALEPAGSSWLPGTVRFISLGFIFQVVAGTPGSRRTLRTRLSCPSTNPALMAVVNKGGAQDVGQGRRWQLRPHLPLLPFLITATVQIFWFSHKS